MGKSIPVTPKKRGRPATGRDPHITARLPEKMIRDLDRLAHKRRVTRSEVLREILEPALDAELGSHGRSAITKRSVRNAP